MGMDDTKPVDGGLGGAEGAAPAAAVAPRPWWWKILGIRRRVRGRRLKFLKVAPTKWGWLVIVMLIGMVGMGAMGEYSMQPEFCQSCHIMEPYYMAWHQSTHKNVPCVDCHFLPGLGNTMYGKFQASSQAVKYITKTYGSKPHAEIQDASCMRTMGSDGVTKCHDTRTLVGNGKVNWTVKIGDGNEVTIKFDHTPHLTQERKGMQLRCVSCHSQIVQGKHIVVTVDTCFLCHFKGVKHGRDDQTLGTCKGCHDAPKKQVILATGVFEHKDYLARGVLCENCHADTVRGDGAVSRQVCWNCHNQTSQITRFDETAFLHTSHVTNHKVECSGCHEQIEHNLLAAEQGRPGPVGVGAGQLVSGHGTMESGTCGLCHDKMHAGPLEMYKGIGGRTAPGMPAEMPSPMARVHVNCIACHQAKKTADQTAQVAGQTFVATQERCNYCHGNKYDGVLDDWRKQITSAMTPAETAIMQAKEALAKRKAAGAGSAVLGAEAELKVMRLLDDAEYNVRFVKLAKGVHNVTYAKALLSAAADNARAALAICEGRAAP